MFKKILLMMILTFSIFANASITGCETGTGMVFVPGEPARGIDSFCISSSVYRTNGVDWAMTGCGLRGKLCSTGEYVQACLRSIIPATPGRWHWTTEWGAGSYARIQFRLWGGAKENSCLSTQNVFPASGSTPAPLYEYRCCQR